MKIYSPFECVPVEFELVFIVVRLVVVMFILIEISEVRL